MEGVGVLGNATALKVGLYCVISGSCRCRGYVLYRYPVDYPCCESLEGPAVDKNASRADAIQEGLCETRETETADGLRRVDAWNPREGESDGICREIVGDPKIAREERSIPVPVL